jgi:hypothetical protein
MERLKVVTDIDDCVKSSGGVRLCGIPLGGVDKQYDRGQFYPGQFMRDAVRQSCKLKQEPSNSPLSCLAAIFSQKTLSPRAIQIFQSKLWLS